MGRGSSARAPLPSTSVPLPEFARSLALFVEPITKLNQHLVDNGIHCAAECARLGLEDPNRPCRCGRLRVAVCAKLLLPSRLRAGRDGDPTTLALLRQTLLGLRTYISLGGCVGSTAPSCRGQQWDGEPSCADAVALLRGDESALAALMLDYESELELR